MQISMQFSFWIIRKQPLCFKTELSMKGFFMNLVIDNTVEVNGKERNDISMVAIRGNKS
ncbi:putative small nuclear ribonucleoprotein G [Orobanche minor]